MPRNYLTKPKLKDVSDNRHALQFKLVGDWDKVIRMMSRLNPEIKRSSIKAQTRIANEIVKKVKGHLQNQDLPWPPLSPTTQELKSKNQLDPRILIGRGTYYHAIQTWRVGNQFAVNIGVKRGVYTYTYGGKKSRWDVAQIAVVHEFSSGRRIPRRPLWNPTIAEMGGASGIKKKFVKYFANTLRRHGIPLDPFRGMI